MTIRQFLNLNNNFMASFLLTMGCLAFTSFLIVMYLSKKTAKNSRNKLYLFMLINVTFTLITEIINLFLIVYDINNLFSNILSIAHWLSFITWFGAYNIYCTIYLEDLEKYSYKEMLKRSKKSILVIIYIIIISIMYVFLPSTPFTYSDMSYINGIADYYIIANLAFIGLLIVVDTFIINKNCPTRRKVAIFLVMIVMLACVIVQLLVKESSIYPLGMSLQIFFLYFIIENPDIQLAKEIESLKAEIEKSNKAKTDFLSNMSHEIRTPMNAIIGFSDSLLNSPNFDENVARNDIQNIAVASNNLLDIINNILDISKIESEKDNLENREFNLSALITELANIIKVRLGTSPIKLIVEMNEKIPTKLYGDATKLYQILLNISNNSVKYTEVGKIKITINPEYTNKNLSEIMLHFKISDTGYGIKKEDFNKLFEKFSRLDSATSNEIEGTGLGLVITKKFVDLMGGKIWFTSEFEVGTTFYIDMPFKVIDSTPIGSEEKNEKVEEEINIDKYIDCSEYTALIVDDNKLNIKVAERILKKYKFNLDSALNGKECISKFKSGKKYDIIFMDHMMPEMDGIETLHILKKLDDYKIPPIVALTANALTGMKEMYLKEGFDFYLSKPINVTELNKIIYKCFNKNNNDTDSGKININMIHKDTNTPSENIKNNNNESNKINITFGNNSNKNDIENNKDEVSSIINEEKSNTEDEININDTDNKNVNDVDISDKNDKINNSKEGDETMEEFLRNNGVDLDKSLEFLGDMEMYNMTIKDFQSEAVTKWEKINECLNNHDMPNYAIYVHSLKSDCKYLGFMTLADLSYQHELKSKENDETFVTENFEPLKEEYNKIIELVNKYISTYNI